MANLKMSIKNDLLYTPIPNDFIDYYMPGAAPVFVLVYLLGFRHCFHNSTALTTKAIADTLQILESDVVNAWRHWEKQGIVLIHTNESDQISIEFLPVSSKKEAKEPKKKKKVLLDNRPEYSVQELEVYKDQSPEINRLFTAAEKSLGRLLKYSDLNMLFGFYDWLRLPVSVIEILLEYCIDNGHSHMNYIEAVAIDWAEKQIQTPEEAKAYIQTFHKDYREILKAFGAGNRNPTPKEAEFMEKWLTTYAMPLPIVLEACDKTMMAVGKANFKYTDKIITEWFENNIRTLEDVKKAEEIFFKNKPAPPEKLAKKSTAKKNRFVNFEGRKWNYEEMEKMEQEYLNQIVKGE